MCDRFRFVLTVTLLHPVCSNFNLMHCILYSCIDTPVVDIAVSHDLNSLEHKFHCL